MTIRQWIFSDILKISQLEAEIFEDPWSYRMFAEAFESPTFSGIVVEESEEIVGYAGYNVVLDEAEIENIAVIEDYRKNGIGTKLLRYMCEKALQAGAEKIFLEVRVSNSNALMLYLKNGFSGIYTRARYYANGEDCLVMCKKLR